ncbi:MAG: GDSL-type esterase/lipase family protein [Clostridiales bacterium]|jgi:lysophospholipase L1-like esterase|nr:GDSL-type esterase/lipase family protein [Clostridiales bacterium]MDR2751347.1 GDSL-type esterase/lipase family protein [Clostridiales bacterium]
MKAASAIIIALLVLVVAMLIGGAVWALGALNATSATVRKGKAVDFKELNSSAEHGQIVFAGDSITEGFNVNEHFGQLISGKRLYNRGISGETSTELLSRIEDDVLSIDPSDIVILVGTNDLAGSASLEDIAGNIESIVELSKKKCPGANIILQGVYPVNPAVTRRFQGILVGHGRTTERIKELNGLLESAATRNGVKWVDLTSDLSGSDGLLKPEYTYDGLHVNGKAYEVIAEKIAPFLSGYVGG